MGVLAMKGRTSRPIALVQKVYLNIQQSRFEWITILGTGVCGNDQKPDQFQPWQEDEGIAGDTLKDLIEKQAAINQLVTATNPEEFETSFAQTLCNWLKEDNFKRSQIHIVMLVHTWDTDHFHSLRDTNAFISDVAAFVDAATMARRYQLFVERMQASRVPAPVESPLALQPLLQLRTFPIRLLAANTEHEVKNVEKDFASQKKMWDTLLKTLDTSSSQMTSFITKTKTAEEREQQSRITKEAKAVAKAEIDAAKKKMRRRRRSRWALLLPYHHAPPPRASCSKCFCHAYVRSTCSPTTSSISSRPTPRIIPSTSHIASRIFQSWPS